LSAQTDTELKHADKLSALRTELRRASSRAKNATSPCIEAGKPLQEPVAWCGPIVMNTQEALQQAFSELQKGTFLKT
jgi:redox-sensitive bicupin YhaK (pirin superfamily)